MGFLVIVSNTEVLKDIAVLMIKGVWFIHAFGGGMYEVLSVLWYSATSVHERLSSRTIRFTNKFSEKKTRLG
jgi:hypothetical protein